MRSALSPVALSLFLVGLLPAQSAGEAFRQTQTDDYTRYELLDPATQSFRIRYDVSATAAGARQYFNAIRVGSEPTLHGVYDLMTGKKLPAKIVSGEVARGLGMQNANPRGQYIQVDLARPVPEGGQARLRIDKTYKDPASYSFEGDSIRFSRSLGIKRNAVVLPAGYELLGCNFPSQVSREEDGRIRISFMNSGPSAAALELSGRKLARSAAAQNANEFKAAVKPNPGRAADSSARLRYRIAERAYQDRDIVYFLQAPETHSFRLYHDYTETRVGVDKYLNIVRVGSKVSDPSAIMLDTGKALQVDTYTGSQIREQKIDIGRTVADETEVVVIRFDPVEEGQSVRLRITETYTDENRYLLSGPDELLWDRSFGRPRNTVVLPAGWYLSENAIPAVIREREDGRISLRYWNDRPDQIRVFVKARRR